MFEEALEYHRKHGPQALLILRGGKPVHESYEGGFDDRTPHALYSGTKSFWGIAALTAQREGLLSLDERVADTIPEWASEPQKARVTLRQLLQLTAGIPFGGLGSAVPLYAKALETPLRDEPGERFTYGGIPLQIFGAVFSRKLAPLDLTPHDFLQSRVLSAAGTEISSWRTLKDGTHPLPTGAFVTAQNWARYGTFVAARTAEFAQCFTGSHANSRYGLCWWLAPAGAPSDLFYASGSGGQAMYVAPSENVVAVRFGNGGSFNHEAFLKRLFKK